MSRKKRFSRLRTDSRRYTEKALAGNGRLRQKHNIGSDMAYGSAGRTGRAEAGEKEY